MNSKRVLVRARVCFVVLALAATMHGQDAGSRDSDKAFLASSFRIDFNSIAISKLAADKSGNPDVKSLAERMIADHETLQQQMKPFADQWQVLIANSMDAQHQELFDKLSGLSGKDFDKQYVKAMDEDHHLAQTKLMSEMATTKDKTFKGQAASEEKVIDKLTGLTDKVDRKLGMTPMGLDVRSI